MLPLNPNYAALQLHHCTLRLVFFYVWYFLILQVTLLLPCFVLVMQQLRFSAA